MKKYNSCQLNPKSAYASGIGGPKLPDLESLGPDRDWSNGQGLTTTPLIRSFQSARQSSIQKPVELNMTNNQQTTPDDPRPQTTKPLAAMGFKLEETSLTRTTAPNSRNPQESRLLLAHDRDALLLLLDHHLEIAAHVPGSTKLHGCIQVAFCLSTFAASSPLSEGCMLRTVACAYGSSGIRKAKRYSWRPTMFTLTPGLEECMGPLCAGNIWKPYLAENLHKLQEPYS